MLSSIDKEINSELKLNQNLKKHYQDRIKSCEMSEKTLDIIIEEDNRLILNKYVKTKKLGSGSFGEVFEAYDLNNNFYAIKFEPLTDYKKHLVRENKIYDTLQDIEINRAYNLRFPKKYDFGIYQEFRVLVLEKLGPSLKSKFIEYNYRFNIKIISKIAVQLLYLLEEFHGKGWLHQDLKPENILLSKDLSRLFLVDYGTSGYWYNETTKSHVVKKLSEKIVGTCRYSSLANHNGWQQSRADDLESLGYVLSYLYGGQLPWQGLKASNFREKWRKVKKIKSKTSIEQLCCGYNLPNAFFLYFKYVQKLDFDQRPNYTYLRNLFRKYYNYTIDPDFDWIVKN